MADSGLEEAIRAARGITELARRIGISQPSVSNWSRVPAERVLAVEAVPMPTALREAIAGFVAAYHVERPFQKRVRDRPNLDALVRRRSNRSRQ